MQSILMHVCCGPCASVPFEIMRDDNTPVTALYYNPNIQPEEEYLRRLETLKELAAAYDVRVMEGSYDPRAWEASIQGFAGVFPLIEGSADFATNRELRRQRCRHCYKHRFTFLVQQARVLGFESVATSLSISPYQFIDDMKEVFSEAANRAGVISVFRDLSNLYPRSIELSRELGLFRQNYCGCSYSKSESELERQARRDAKKRARNAGREQCGTTSSVAQRAAR